MTSRLRQAAVAAQRHNVQVCFHSPAIHQLHTCSISKSQRRRSDVSSRRGRRPGAQPQAPWPSMQLLGGVHRCSHAAKRTCCAAVHTLLPVPPSQHHTMVAAQAARQADYAPLFQHFHGDRPDIRGRKRHGMLHSPSTALWSSLHSRPLTRRPSITSSRPALRPNTSSCRVVWMRWRDAPMLWAQKQRVEQMGGNGSAAGKGRGEGERGLLWRARVGRANTRHWPVADAAQLSLLSMLSMAFLQRTAHQLSLHIMHAECAPFNPQLHGMHAIRPLPISAGIHVCSE